MDVEAVTGGEDQGMRQSQGLGALPSYSAGDALAGGAPTDGSSAGKVPAGNALVGNTLAGDAQVGNALAGNVTNNSEDEGVLVHRGRVTGLFSAVNPWG